MRSAALHDLQLENRIALIGFDDIVLADLVRPRCHGHGTRSHPARHRLPPSASSLGWTATPPPCRPSVAAATLIARGSGRSHPLIIARARRIVSSEPMLVKGAAAVTISETIPLSRNERLDGGTRGRGRRRPASAESSGWALPSPVASTRHCCLRSPRGLLARERVVALLGVSPSLAAEERSAAHDVARQVGVTTRRGGDP